MRSHCQARALSAFAALLLLMSCHSASLASNPPLCPHVIGWNSDINTWAQGAPWIKVIFANDIAPAEAAGAKVFYRPFTADTVYWENGYLPSQRTGAEYADLVWAQISGLAIKPDAVSYRNEFDWSNATAAKRTCAEFVNYKNRLRQVGYTGKVIFGSFGPDWVSASTWQDPDLMAAVNASDGVETHEYFDFSVDCCKPNRCFRHRDIAIANNTYLQSKDWYIGEFGSDVDHGACSYCGDGLWRTGWRDRNKLTEQQYITQMQTYRSGCASQVVAVFVFQQGDQTSWSNYEVVGTSVATYMKTTWVANPGKLVGQVKNAAGSTLAGATIFASPGGYTSQTSASGVYTYFVPPGIYTITARMPGYAQLSTANREVKSDLTTPTSFILLPLIGIKNAHALSDGASAAVTGIVTARFPVSGPQDTIYVQNESRTTGIAVTTGTQVALADVVEAQGAMSSVSGERVLAATAVATTQSGGPSPRALGVRNMWLGGGQFGNQLAVLDNSSMLTYATGLSNVGLLVHAWGAVGLIDAGGAYFYLDDGTGIMDGPGHTGVRVACSGLQVPTGGTYVRVVGICGVMQIGGRCVRLLRPRSNADLSYASGN